MDLHVERIRNDPDYRERWFATLARTVAIDFDGVLHPYTEGWKGFVPVDEKPWEGAREFLEQLRSEGFTIVVFSTRCESEEGLNGTTEWLRKHDLLPLIADVTCQKPAAVAYVDDRAVTFRGDWGEVWRQVHRLTESQPHGGAQIAAPERKTHRRFVLNRIVDETGVSGTGVVAEGVLFSNGIVALHWTSEFPTSVVFHHRGMESVEKVHGHSGSTRIEWLD